MLFYFDIHDHQGIWADEEGLELPDMRAAQREAALSLADIAQQQTPDEHHRAALHVRTPAGPLFKVTFTFEPDLRRAAREGR